MLKPGGRWPASKLTSLGLVVFLILTAVAFVIAFGARPAVIISSAGHDDALFVRLARNLAEGHWLGRYTETTLIKGPGFPAFLALSNLFGLTFPSALALFHLAAAALAGFVTRRVLGSSIAASALFVLLLLLPPLYQGDALRVNREVFYTSLTVGLAASALLLSAGRPGVLLVGLVGLLLGWFWLTREEGVWLVPGLLILALLPQAGEADGRPTRRERARRAAPFAGAAMVAVAVVILVGVLNFAVYGRFVVNELKDSAFQGAVTALQDAAAAHRRDRVPTPAAARAQIYPLSAAFAQLRPVLDGPAGGTWMSAGCATDPRICGDLGGGWFIWAVREGASLAGHHATARAAAAYYRQIETEVRAACRAGRLDCRGWPVPLVPPLGANQMGAVGGSLVRTLDVTTLGAAVRTKTPLSEFDASDAADTLAFLGSPRAVGPTVTRRICGSVGDRPLSVEPGPGVSVRVLDPDRVSGAGACLAVTCPRETCPVAVLGVSQDLDTLTPGTRQIGADRLVVELADTIGEERYLKHRFSDAWTRAAAGLTSAYRLLFVLGALAYVALLIQALRTRRLSAPVIVCTALAAAAASRIAILALIDALAFPAAATSYALPATALFVVFAVYALHAGVSALMSPGQFLARHARDAARLS